MIFLSIVTTTFNRKDLVVRSIDSSLQFIEQAHSNIELIVVDDASADQTFEYLKSKYQEELKDGIVKLIRSDVNVGATGAKNLGGLQAKGRWLLFIDSDDLIIADRCHELVTILKEHDQFPMIFFRCIDLKTGRLIGPYYKEPFQFSLKQLLNCGTPGECLPAINTSKFLQFKYSADLRGCEGLTYVKILNRYGPGLVETLIVRKYNTTTPDRLSSRKEYIVRSCHIGKYHRTILLHYFRHLTITTLTKTIVKIICYYISCFGITFIPQLSINKIKQRFKSLFAKTT
jgi:glycosyltransferase involved in cell wall biosynthesis